MWRNTYGCELTERCMKCHALGNLGQLKLFPGSSCAIKHQKFGIFDTNRNPQAACNYMLVSMASSQEVMCIIRAPGFPKPVNIHRSRMVSGVLCGKYQAFEDINEANLHNVCKIEIFTGRVRRNFKDVMNICRKCCAKR